MTKRKNSHYTKRDGAIDPYKNLVSDIIADAVLIVSSQIASSETDYVEAMCFLHSEKCERWAGMLGIDWNEITNHPDSLIRKVSL